MSDRTGMDDFAAGAGVPVDGDGMPRVRYAGDLNLCARHLGELVSRFDLYELNGELIFFDHRGRRRAMIGRVFRTWIMDHVLIWARANEDGAERPMTLKDTDAVGILESMNFRRGVRECMGENYVRLPVLRGDGNLELLPEGYDEETQYYTIPGGLKYDLDMDLDAAKGWLGRCLGDFPFEGERALWAQVGAMLALYVKHLPGGDSLRPGLLWMANKPGSGKSVLAKMCLYPVLGHAATAKMKKGEELDKELEAFMRGAVPYIFLDNVYGRLASASIDQMMTSEESTGRAMGGHGLFTARNSAMLLVTGNDLDLNDDAARRFLMIDLFERGEPDDRKVKMPLTDRVMRSDEWRSKTLSALWAMVKHWHEEGMPAPGSKMPSFEEYCQLLGGIVKAAGYGEIFEQEDMKLLVSPEKAEFLELLGILLKDMETVYEGEEVADNDLDKEGGGVLRRDYTMESLVTMARAHALFTDIVGTVDDGKALTVKREGLAGEARNWAEDKGLLSPAGLSKFGKLLAKYVGTVPKVAGRKLEFGRRSQKRKRVFTIEKVGRCAPVPGAE